MGCGRRPARGPAPSAVSEEISRKYLGHEPFTGSDKHRLTLGQWTHVRSRRDGTAGGGRGPRRRRPARVLEQRKLGARAEERGKLRLRRPVVRAAPRHRRHRGRHLGRRLPARRAASATSRWVGRAPRRSPRSPRSRSRAALRGVHADRDEADRRRPRPPAPAAPDLAAGRARWPSSRGRPARSPRPPTPSPRPPRPTWTSSSPRGWPRAGSPRSRPTVAMAIAKYHPELLERAREAGQEVLARHPAPPRPRRVRRHQLPRRRRRHPRPDRLPRPRLRPGRRAQGARRHRRPRGPQGQGPRRDRHPAGHPRPPHPHRRRRQRRRPRAGRDRPGAAPQTGLYAHASLTGSCHLLATCGDRGRRRSRGSAPPP